MPYNPIHDSKFWTLLIDAVVGLTTFFVGKYAGFALEDVLTVIGVIQPIFVALVVGFLQRDNAERDEGIRAGFLAKK